MVSQQGVNKWFSRTTIDHRVGPEGGGDVEKGFLLAGEGGIQTALRQEVAISLRRGGEAAGKANAATGQLANHFA